MKESGGLHHQRATERAALLVAALSSFLAPFMGSAINIALPAIGSEFRMNAIALGWVATVYLVTAGGLLMPFGKWADMRGRKMVFCWGMCLYAIISLALGFANSGPVLIGLRALQGVGSAMMFATGMALLMSVIPPPERGKALGINVAAVYLGLSMGPVLGGFLTQHFGWRSLFFTNAAIGTLVLLVAVSKLNRDIPATTNAKFDLTGSLIYAFSIAALMFGFSHLRETHGILACSAGLLLLILFLFWESKVEHPILDLNLFRHNTVYAMSNLAALINYSATAAVTFLLSLYLQNVLEMSAQAAGLALVVQPALMAFLSPVAGSLSDRMEPRRVASLGMGLTTAGLFLFAFGGESLSLPFIITNLILLGCGFALFSSPNTNAVMSSVDKHLYGTASATLGTMRLTGQMLSMGIVLLIFALKMGKTDSLETHNASFVTSMKLAFLVFSVLCSFGIMASLARGKLRS